MYTRQPETYQDSCTVIPYVFQVYTWHFCEYAWSLQE